MNRTPMERDVQNIYRTFNPRQGLFSSLVRSLSSKFRHLGEGRGTLADMLGLEHLDRLQ